MTLSTKSFRIPEYDYPLYSHYYDSYYYPSYYRYKYCYPSYLDYDNYIYPYTNRYLRRLEVEEDLRQSRRLRYLDLIQKPKDINLNASLKVNVDVKAGLKKSEMQQETILRDMVEKQSPLQIVQNFKTVTGYERRLTTDELMKLYADKAAVQRIIYLAFTETFKVVESLFDILKSKSKLKEKTVERVITRVRVSSTDVLKLSAEPILGKYIEKVADVAIKIQTTDYSILLEKQLLKSETEILDEHLYRRSFDSSYNTSRVKYFISPPLMDNQIVLVKGEAFTQK